MSLTRTLQLVTHAYQTKGRVFKKGSRPLFDAVKWQHVMLLPTALGTKQWLGKTTQTSVYPIPIAN
jgi:hypothetical protein